MRMERFSAFKMVHTWCSFCPRIFAPYRCGQMVPPSWRSEWGGWVFVCIIWSNCHMNRRFGVCARSRSIETVFRNMLWTGCPWGQQMPHQ
jgi:hypothetical protein